MIARDLIRFDTTNHGEGRSNGEREAAEYVEAKLRALGLEPQLFEPEPRRTNVVARVPGRNPDKPALVRARPPRRRARRRPQLERRPVRGRDPRRHAVGPRRRRHEGHGRDDARRARRHPARRGPARARARDRVLRRRGGRRRPRRELARRPPSRAVRRGDRGDQRGRRLLDHGRRAARLPAADGGEVPALGAPASPAASPRTARGSSATTRSRSSPRRSRASAAREWPIRLTDTTRELLGEIAGVLGVDPEQVSPDELALATGSASGFITATLRTTIEPDPARRPATSTT